LTLRCGIHTKIRVIITLQCQILHHLVWYTHFIFYSVGCKLTPYTYIWVVYKHLNSVMVKLKLKPTIKSIVYDQLCNNQSYPLKLRLVGYSSIFVVAWKINLFCKLYKILLGFLHMCFLSCLQSYSITDGNTSRKKFCNFVCKHGWVLHT